MPRPVYTLTLSAALLGIAPAPVWGQRLPSVTQVIDQLDDLYRSNSSHAMMTMTVYRERGTRTLTLEAWSLGDDEALIVIRAPSREAGTATLRTGDGLWNYAPRADRLIRIPAGLLSENWMGSHFTNDDLLRETSYLDDHTASLAWIQEDGRTLLEVTMTPAEDAPVVYTRLVFRLQPETWTPTRAEYFDGDKLTRTLTFEQVKRIGNRMIPLKMTVQPADEPDERTVIVYDSLELDIPVDPDLFTRRGLRRVAQN